MENKSNFKFLRLVIIVWKIAFVFCCFFLAYSIYEQTISAIVFCIVFLLFNAFIIKKYSSIVKED